MFVAVAANNGVQYVTSLVKNFPVRFWPWRRFALSEHSEVVSYVLTRQMLSFFLLLNKLTYRLN